MPKFILFFYILLNCLSIQAVELKRVALITPRAPKDAFWGPFSRFAECAANHFSYNLQTYYAMGDHHEMTALVEKVMREKVDAVILSNFKMQGKHAVELAEKYKIPILFVTGGFDESEKMGEPRLKYPYWLGQLLPDDQQAGQRLLEELYKLHQRLWPKTRPFFFGVEGNIADSGSYERKKGVQGILSNYNLEYTQFVAANWDRSIAKEKYTTFKKSRYPQINLIWSASDHMALGIVEAASGMGLKSGRDYVIGGVDWSPEAIDAVSKNDLQVSVGGHLYQGGWALVLLYDYFNGFDFATEKTTFRTEMMALTHDNLPQYREILDVSKCGKINFSRFSKAKNPLLKNYNFSLNRLLQN